jgi:hypothetical protein
MITILIIRGCIILFALVVLAEGASVGEGIIKKIGKD